MPIVWDPETMTTGVAAIDEEHQEWIRRFNEFDAATASGLGLEAIQKTLDFMIEYAENHFSHEERLSKEIHTLEADANRREHQEFRSNIRYHQNWIKLTGATIVEVVGMKIELKDWLEHHICAVDRHVWQRNP
jgi:hemerythrin-like metal-binding protein